MSASLRPFDFTPPRVLVDGFLTMRMSAGRNPNLDMRRRSRYPKIGLLGVLAVYPTGEFGQVEWRVPFEGKLNVLYEQGPRRVCVDGANVDFDVVFDGLSGPLCDPYTDAAIGIRDREQPELNRI